MSFIKFAKYCALIFLLVPMFLFVKSEPCLAKLPAHKLPDNVIEALANATHITLYSLDSTSPHDISPEKLYRFKILGKIELQNLEAKKATTAFQDAISNWDRSGNLCFEPHHAIRLKSNGHVYDYLLCYMCEQMEVYIDGKYISGVGITGSPDVLNGMLTAAHIPLSYIYSPEYKAAEKKRIQDDEDSYARWLAAMPKSILPLWTDKNSNPPPSEDFNPSPHPFYDPNHRVSEQRNNVLKPFRIALNNDSPDKSTRILELLKWYGSGKGPWSGYPMYESYATGLLFDYPTQDIISAIKKVNLTKEQIEGAARFFGSDIPFYQSKDMNLLH